MVGLQLLCEMFRCGQLGVRAITAWRLLDIKTIMRWDFLVLELQRFLKKVFLENNFFKNYLKKLFSEKKKFFGNTFRNKFFWKKLFSKKILSKKLKMFLDLGPH